MRKALIYILLLCSVFASAQQVDTAAVPQGKLIPVEGAFLQQRVGISVGALVHQVEFRVPEQAAFVVRGVFSGFDDLPIVHKQRAEGVEALLAGADGQVVAMADVRFVVHGGSSRKRFWRIQQLPDEAAGEDG